jgi:hypothetical protein
MAERGIGRVAHGTHGIHGNGEGGGREPGESPANYAKGREWGKRDLEEWPTEHTEYTERERAEGGIRRRRGESWRESICGRGSGHLPTGGI